MKGKRIDAKRCACGGHALRMEEGGQIWLRCSGCGRETAKDGELAQHLKKAGRAAENDRRIEAGCDALITEWNVGAVKQ